MEKLFLAILTFIAGFYTKKYFDNRDLRRKILEPVFDEFEKHIIYLQTEWRNIQLSNINQKQFNQYCDVFNKGKDKFYKVQTDMVFACKKIREKTLIPLIDEAFSSLLRAMGEYSHFLDRRDQAEGAERHVLIKILNDANAKFDKTFPVAMEKVYNRYWTLISDTLFVETMKSKLKEYFG
jgi:hypothetical protein